MCVDATYGSDLRELNEINFARFDAKVEQRFAEFRAEMQIGFRALETSLIRWMFVFSIAHVVTMTGIVYGLLKLTGR